MPKRRTRKILRGGAWYNPMDWFSSDPTAPKRSWSDWWNSTTSSAESTLSAANPFSSTTSSYTPPNPMPAPAPMPEPTYESMSVEEPQQLGPVGGRRRRRHSRKHSKKGGSLASTAETVSNTKTAVPTYWIKGGRRTRRRSRRHRKH